MKHIRVRLTLKLNGEHIDAFPALKAAIETAVAQSLPEEFAVDTVKVTRINEAKSQPTEVE